MTMNIYTVWATAGRYEINALIKAQTKQAARNKLQRQSHNEYRIRSVKVVTKNFIDEMELEKELAQIKRAPADKIIVYDAGT